MKQLGPEKVSTDKELVGPRGPDTPLESLVLVIISLLASSSELYSLSYRAPNSVPMNTEQRSNSKPVPFISKLLLLSCPLIK